MSIDTDRNPEAVDDLEERLIRALDGLASAAFPNEVGSVLTVPMGNSTTAVGLRRLLAAAATVLLVAAGAALWAGSRSNDSISTVQGTEARTVPSALSTVVSEPPTTTDTDTSEPMDTDGEAALLGRTLREGDSGEDVRMVQVRLHQLGFESGRLDGVFTTLTTHAVWAFEKLVLQVPPSEATGEVTPEIWRAMQDDVVVTARRPSEVDNHVEVYLPEQVMAVFQGDESVLVAHVSTGSLDTDGTPAEYCDAATINELNGTALADVVSGTICGVAKTPGGVFQVQRIVEGERVSDLGAMTNPVYFNYGVAIYGADNVPNRPASYGGVMVSQHIAGMLLRLVSPGDAVLVWNGDSEPEDVTFEASLPWFNSVTPGQTDTPGTGIEIGIGVIDPSAIDREARTMNDLEKSVMPNGLYGEAAFASSGPVLREETVYYPVAEFGGNDVQVTTVQYTGAVDLSDWAEEFLATKEVEWFADNLVAVHMSPALDPSTSEEGLGILWVMWQPAADTTVLLTGVTDEVMPYSRSLMLVDPDTANIPQRVAVGNGVFPDDATLVIQAQDVGPLENFYYYEFETALGSCDASGSTRSGGGSRCVGETSNEISDICMHGVNQYEDGGQTRVVAYALVDADAADTVEIREYPIPGTEPVDANVITGESNGVEWALVWFEWVYDGPAPEVSGSRIWMGNGLC